MEAQQRLARNPILREVLAGVPAETREAIVSCIMNPKREFSLTPEAEDEVFNAFTAATQAYIEAIIREVLDAL